MISFAYIHIHDKIVHCSSEKQIYYNRKNSIHHSHFQIFSVVSSNILLSLLPRHQHSLQGTTILLQISFSDFQSHPYQLDNNTNKKMASKLDKMKRLQSKQTPSPRPTKRLQRTSVKVESIPMAQSSTSRRVKAERTRTKNINTDDSYQSHCAHSFGDIACGRSCGRLAHDAPNVKFKNLIKSLRDLYDNSVNGRTDKRRLCQVVLDLVLEQGGRFVQQCKSTKNNRWEELPYRKCLEKIGQTFRDLRGQSTTTTSSSSGSSDTASIGVAALRKIVLTRLSAWDPSTARTMHPNLVSPSSTASSCRKLVHRRRTKRTGKRSFHTPRVTPSVRRAVTPTQLQPEMTTVARQKPILTRPTPRRVSIDASHVAPSTWCHPTNTTISSSSSSSTDLESTTASKSTKVRSPHTAIPADYEVSKTTMVDTDESICTRQPLQSLRIQICQSEQVFSPRRVSMEPSKPYEEGNFTIIPSNQSVIVSRAVDREDDSSSGRTLSHFSDHFNHSTDRCDSPNVPISPITVLPEKRCVSPVSLDPLYFLPEHSGKQIILLSGSRENSQSLSDPDDSNESAATTVSLGGVVATFWEVRMPGGEAGKQVHNVFGEPEIPLQT